MRPSDAPNVDLSQERYGSAMPCSIQVNSFIMQQSKMQLTSVHKSSEPAHTTAAELGALAQLQHTAYPPQQPASTEHVSQLAAASESRAQKEWHKRHMSRTPPPSPQQSPSGASACPLAHSREKSTFFGHTRPSSSSHSVLKLRQGINFRFDGRIAA